MARMPSTESVDYRLYNPLHPADWRWQAALRYQQQETEPLDCEDPLITDLIQLLHCLSRGDINSLSEDLLHAHAIYSAGGPLRDEIEARLLSGQSMEIIAQKTLVTVPVLMAFVPAFFDVIGCLGSIGWITLRIIRLTPGQTVTEGQIWKYLAIAAGPVALETMVDDFYQRPTDDPAHRASLAAKGRYTVREFAGGWHSLPAVAALLDEGRRVFSHLGRGSSRKDKLYRVQLQSLRLMLKPRKSPKLRKKPLIGQKTAQKEVHNEPKKKSQFITIGAHDAD